MYTHILTYCIFFRVADFHPKNVVQEPINGLLLIEHKYEFHNQSEVWRLKHFTWKDIPVNGRNKEAKMHMAYIRETYTTNKLTHGALSTMSHYE